MQRILFGFLPRSCGRVAGTALALAGFCFAPSVLAQSSTVTVSTLGGGPVAFCGAAAGSINGATTKGAQFHTPYALALDSGGNLYVADVVNREVRKINTVGATSVTTSFLKSLPGLIGVATDASDDLFVLQARPAKLLEYNKFGNSLLGLTIAGGFIPSALAIPHDGTSNVFVACTNKSTGIATIFRFNVTSATTATNPTVTAAFKWKPTGITVTSGGQLAVSDTLSNAIYLVSTNDGSTPVLLAGANTNALSHRSTAGYVDGTSNFVQFDQPHGVVATSDGHILVADTLNNRVRVVDNSGTTTTLFGTSTADWGKACCSCSPSVYPGWVDGTAGTLPTSAESRQPLGLTLSTTGTLYDTEATYDLVRSATGSGFDAVPFTTGTTGGGGNGGNTNVVVTNTIAAPIFSPASGYYPECATITVTSTVPNVFYTTDGTVPTTNSFQVTTVFVQTNNVQNSGYYVGTFQWCNSQLDLSSMKIIASSGSNVSVVATGQASTTNGIGFTRTTYAGVGSTAIAPIVVNLLAGTPPNSLSSVLK